MDTAFVMDQLFNAPVNKVWQALTDENKVREWYFPQLKRLVPEVGFVFEFNDDGSSYKKEWQVTQVVAERKLAHSWSYKGYPGWSEVIFELFEQGDKTLLKLTHTGISSFPDDPHFARGRFENGWSTIIRGNLKSYLERNP